MYLCKYIFCYQKKYNYNLNDLSNLYFLITSHDGKRHKPMSKAKAEREKLLHKIKKEAKSAIREIRLDTAFISKVQIKRQLKDDQIRKDKIKQIYGDAAVQQHEWKKSKKKNS